MIEIKVTGNTAEEIKESMIELNKVINMDLAAQEMTAGIQIEEQPKEVKAEAVTKSKKEAKEESTKEEPHDNHEQVKGEEASYTIVDVRAKAVELQRAGKKDLVKGVIEATGASKLSEVPEDKYAYAMKCFEAGEVL